MALADIVYRKAAMNLSFWNTPTGPGFYNFSASGGLFLLPSSRPVEKNPGCILHLRTGFIAGISGTFIALAVNDSGIVAAATSMIFHRPRPFLPDPG
jgi:hypothetical protein